MKTIKKLWILIFPLVFLVSCNEEIGQDLSQPELDELEHAEWEFEFSKEMIVFSQENEKWVKLLIQTDNQFLLGLEGNSENWEILLHPEDEEINTASSERNSNENPEIPTDLKPELHISVIDHNFGEDSQGFGLKHSDKYTAELEFARTNNTLQSAYVHPFWRAHTFAAPVRYERVRFRRYNNPNVSNELNTKPVGSVFQYRNCGVCSWNNGTGLNWIYQPGIHDEYVRTNIRRIRVIAYHYGPIPNSTNGTSVSNTNFSIFWWRY